MSPRKPPPDAVPDLRHDYGVDAHQAAVEHLMKCYEAWEVQGPDEEGHRPVSPASEPFDGCTDCEVREILYAAWPFLRLAALAGAR